MRRDLILLAGTILITLAAMVYLNPLIAVAIGAGVFFGLKAITSNRQAVIDKQVGEGLCAECGEKITGGRCPSCESEQNPAE